VLRPLFALLRTFAPIVVIGNRAVVSRYADVVEVLARDDDFTISQINAAAIDRHDGPFILGMDRGPDYDRDLAILRQAARSDDLERIRLFVANAAASQLEAARAAGILDVVNGYARVVAVRLVASYFGMSGPDEQTMMRRLRDIFYDVFLNLTNDAKVRSAATRSGVALRAHMDAVIADRKATRRGAPSDGAVDDVLGRLIALQGPDHPSLDDDAVRRNLSGLIVGAVETTSKFVTLAIFELMRRPDAFSRAQAAAIAGDVDTVRCYVYEAARFNPHTPLLFRYCARDAEIAGRTRRARTLRAGTTVVIGNLSAMFDPAAFASPGTFRADHDSASLHFGYGMHRCFGAMINDVQISELVATLLRVRGLRPAAGRAASIRWDGPFPDRYLLEFD
jgi:cytochrome P450